MDRKSVTPHRYNSIAMTFHWITAALVLATFVMGPGGSEQRVYAAAKDFDRQIHEVLGLTVFGFTLLRFIWRAFASAPPTLQGPYWMKCTSRIVQQSLYALLVVTPLSAISGAWLEGHPLTLGILGNIPPMIPESRAVGQIVAAVHTILGDIIVWLAGFHAAAALFHHFVLRDEVLLSMLPQLRKRGDRT